MPSIQRTHSAQPLAYMAALLVVFALPMTFAHADIADFTLKEAGGNATFQWSQARGHYVALHFLLKTDCPNCMNHVRSYMQSGEASKGVQHVFIKPDSEDAIREWSASLKDATGNKPVIYRDPDARLAESLGVPDGYSFHGETVHFPALIVYDPDGKEVFRYAGKDTSDRYPAASFVKKLSELRRMRAVSNYNLDDGGVALQGYDPVSYFEGSGPKQGKKNFSVVFAGGTYYFVDTANREAFLANPDRYLPAYGGWCATAMAFGKKVEVDPENFKITNGRLFLFYKSLIQNALNDWNRHEAQWTVDADGRWKEISGEM